MPSYLWFSIVLKSLSCLNSILQVYCVSSSRPFQNIIASSVHITSSMSGSASPSPGPPPIDSPSPGAPSPGSSSVSPSRPPPPLLNPPPLHPALHAATDDFRGGHRSFLDVIFDANLNYDGVRTFILQGLNTANFDNLRQTCRSIDHCLMMPTAAGPPHLRHFPDLIDRCHDFGLSVPPSLPPRGSCPNPPQSTVRIRACQFYDHDSLRFANPHQNITTHPREHLVCEICRRNWHDNIATLPGHLQPPQISRHDYWRRTLAGAHITVCSLCDREQKRQYYPEGHDGCICYREYYKKRWLCQRCDIQNRHNISRDITGLTGMKRYLKQVGNQMQVMPVAQGPANLPQPQSWCPCGRQVSEQAPPGLPPIPIPWPGNHNIIAPVLNPVTLQQQQTTKQCVLCCGYIVPRVPTVRQPTRRSARLADRKSGTQKDRKHTMLGRNGKAAARHGVNSKGFEVRGRGGWA